MPEAIGSVTIIPQDPIEQVKQIVMQFITPMTSAAEPFVLILTVVAFVLLVMLVRRLRK